jgi:hypothetical protein
MSHQPSVGLARLLGVAAMLIAIDPALSHTIVGDRVFPATLTIDDPGVNDELALPAFAYTAASNFDETLGALQYTFAWEYSKTITADLGISVGSAHTWQRNPSAQGWSNIETQLKYVFYQNPEHEFIIAGAGNFDWGSTGSSQSSSLPSDQFTTITPKLYVGKGFGDVGVDWARPFALTGEIDYSFSIHPIDVTGVDAFGNVLINQTPTALTYGFTVQYSLLYMNSFVKEVPEFFNRLIPTFEGVFTSPVSNIGPSIPGQFVHTTTGTVGPGLYYIGNYFQIGVSAQFPINRASGNHVGALAILDLFLDDIFPDTIGKPLFGPPQQRGLQQTVSGTKLY